jgi:hypothetical protein
VGLSGVTFGQTAPALEISPGSAISAIEKRKRPGIDAAVAQDFPGAPGFSITRTTAAVAGRLCAAAQRETRHGQSGFTGKVSSAGL